MPTATAFRSPKRVSITVSQSVAERLEQRSGLEGRSTSNLAAYLLEVALDALEPRPNSIAKHWPPEPR
ncbi:MAG: ribbon-helix-helix domain-containing protein [Prochlorococcaceae cyanobacterium]